MHRGRGHWSIASCRATPTVGRIQGQYLSGPAPHFGHANQEGPAKMVVERRNVLRKMKGEASLTVAFRSNSDRS